MNLRDLPDMTDALRQVQMYEAKKKGDGNLANNAVPYDRVTQADIVTGALGQDEEGGKKKPKGHDCAKLVKYAPDGSVKEEFDVIPEMHTMLEDGTVTHYDITNGKYIYENVPVEDLEILISEKHEHFDNYDKNAEVLGENRAAARAAGGYKDDSKKQTDPSKAGFTGIGNMSIDQIRRMSARIEKEKKKQEAFAFSDAEWQELAMLGEEIDVMTDEELIDFMEEIILEVAEDEQDLLEICEALDEVEVISERMDPKEIQRRRDQAKDRLATGAAMKSAAEKSSAPARPSRLQRMKSAAKSAAKKVGGAVKAGAKLAGKAAVSTAGKVAGTYQGEKEAARIKAKRASMQKTPAKEKSDDDDGTGGKLDKLLADTRGKSSSSTSSSGGGGVTVNVNSHGSSSGGGSSSKSGETRRAAGGALRSVGRLVKKGLKKAVGKTSRLISKGSDKLARRLGEDYEHIAHLYESGLFTMEEIENVIEERYKGKHGQSDKEYADSRSDGGKMVSGDSKQSGAEFTHGRRVKAANPGMQSDVGGKTKPKSQGRMDSGTRADLLYRKAMLKKQEADKKKGK
ncbi:hypothetical protein [Synechococcus phage S-B64]|uniref:Uncharacterized protein n=2 Tax=Shandvirus TaxID=2948904 RepID=A0A1Z1LWG1_9CAUD|nr:cytidyltransferase [Synechococcus phage S-H35]YP_010095318.1 cytidyltransferase [Synechococcus phage S-B64]ARW56999.1 hypothetical protein [Synechococcus phage S-H35]AWD90116.1 hypothetical protein [Synechococcus phage S-B64]